MDGSSTLCFFEKKANRHETDAIFCTCALEDVQDELRLITCTNTDLVSL